MAEIYASNAKANTGVALGASALGVAAINMLGGTDIFKRLFGGNSCNGDSTPLVNRYELDLQNRISELEGEVKLRDSYIYTDSRFTSGFEKLTNKYDAEIAELKAQINHQSVINAQTIANLSCMQGSINTLMGLTKTIIPIGNVCPSPMPEYNSWTAPTTTTTTGA